MKFEKYNGLGNDFLLFEYEEGIDYHSLAIKYCERHIGIGADGLIVVKTNPLEMQFYNMDGSMATMCGNGIRAFAYYCYKHNLIDSDIFKVQTGAGLLEVEIITKEPFVVKIYMGIPQFDKNLLHLKTEYTLPIEIEGYNTYSVFMGTVHTVILVDDINNIRKAKEIHEHKYFGEKTNVNFVQKLDNKTLAIRTYERGVGYTLACGTGSCAAAVIANKYFNMEDVITCKLKYGDLIINTGEKIYMTGSADYVCKGEI